jgi:hypothetical protein
MFCKFEVQTQKVKQTIGITGGTGTVGGHLIPLLVGAGYEVVVLTRNAKVAPMVQGVTYAMWNPERKQCDEAAMSRLTGIVHLAGEPVAGKRWTEEQKKRIYDSRVSGTQYLVSTLEKLGTCKVFIGASAIGFYGADKVGGSAFTEDAAPSGGFLEETCAAWEAEEKKAEKFAKTTILRIGIVLAKEGGAFPEFIRTLKFGVLGVPGSGKQVISWIHVDDLASMFLYALQKENMTGVYNAVSPHPVTCRQLIDTIANEKKGMFLKVPVPAIALKLAMGEMSIEVLKSTKVSAQRIVDSGFSFKYPSIEMAVAQLLQ